ncbi:MAG: type VI secretion system Vgr family protein, partial [Geminicoccales bacterium]
AAAISFEVSVSGMAPGALRVVTVEGEEALSRPYRFEIEAVSDDPNLAVDALPGKPATLTMRRETDERQIHGVIAEVDENGMAAGGFYAYRLVLVPRLWLLTLSRHNRTFGTVTPMTVVEVVSAVLSERDGLQLGGEDYAFRLSDPGAYPARPFWAQYNESDLDFISRLLEHWGIAYYFEQGADEEKLVFVDSNIMMPRQQIDGDLPYDSRAGAPLGGRGIAQSLRRRLRPVPKQARLKDYNYELPQLALEASQPVADGTFGEYVEYAAHFRDTAEGNVLARARAEELGSRRDVFELETDSLFVSAGQLFSLHDHFRSALNQDYLPTVVRHFGEQPLAGAYANQGGARPGYHNEVSAIPAETAYRPARRTPQAKVPQLMPAVVDAEEAMSERAMLDPQGRYKVAVDFDMTQNPVYKRSAYLRMAQPYAGPEAGLHFPLRKGTEVLLGWRDGDPDRPLILSAVPNPLTASPVTQLNHTENKIHTPSGIMLVMNDGPGNAGGGSGAPAEQA